MINCTYVPVIWTFVFEITNFFSIPFSPLNFLSLSLFFKPVIDASWSPNYRGRVKKKRRKKWFRLLRHSLPSSPLNNSFSKRQLVKFVRRSRISVPLVNIPVESDEEEERRKLCGPEYEILPEMWRASPTTRALISFPPVSASTGNSFLYLGVLNRLD